MFDTKEKTKDDSKRELTKGLITYVSPHKKWIVFCWFVSHHGQESKWIYEDWMWKSYLQFDWYVQNNDQVWNATWILYPYLYDDNSSLK